MLNYKLIISTQYFENYAAHNEDWDGIQEAWKPKGGVDFVVDMDSSTRMYASKDNIKAAIDTVLLSKSNLVVRYELVGYEFMDSNPENITEQFTAELTKIFNRE